jgi:DNA-binding transcriptional LysR family regulator
MPGTLVDRRRRWNAQTRTSILAEMQVFEWGDLRFLLAVERAGSFAAAARRLRVDQATVGRRLRALQEAAGTPLLERTARSLTLTEAGRRALSAAEAMDEAALRLERSLDTARPEVAGTLRITATDALASRLLAPRIPALLADHPALCVELHSGNERLSLSRREADLALRLARPVEPTVAARRAGSLGFALYASRGYLRTRGAPGAATLRAHALLGYERALGPSAATGWVDEVAGGRVVLRASTAAALLAAAAAGLGVAALPCFVADAEPELVRVLPEVRVRELWIAVHADLRRSPRARVGLEFLAAVLASEAESLRGAQPGATSRTPSASPARRTRPSHRR